MPLIGVGLDFFIDPLTLMTRAREMGDFVQLCAPGPSIYCINQPALIEQVLLTDAKNYTRGASTRQLMKLTGNGLLVSDGELWRTQRRIIQPSFQRQRVEHYATLVTQCVETMMRGWTVGDQMPLHPALHTLTFDIIAQTLLGEDFQDEAPAISSDLDKVTDFCSDPLRMYLPFINKLPIPGNFRIKKALATLESFITRVIERRRNNPVASDDMLTRLIAAQAEGKMDEQQLRDEVVTIVLTGHETVTVALNWVFWVLAKYPQVRSRVQAESKALGHTPSLSDAEALPYTTAVLNETLRLYPPVWAFGREALVDCNIGPYHVEAGAQICFSPFALHRNPRYFSEPESFRPERWLDGTQIQRWTHIPFGGGARPCIGANFAMIEMLLIVASISQKFTVAMPTDQEPGFRPRVTLQPRTKLMATLAPARESQALALTAPKASRCPFHRVAKE